MSRCFTPRTGPVSAGTPWCSVPWYADNRDNVVGQNSINVCLTNEPMAAARTNPWSATKRKEAPSAKTAAGRNRSPRVGKLYLRIAQLVLTTAMRRHLCCQGPGVQQAACTTVCACSSQQAPDFGHVAWFGVCCAAGCSSFKHYFMRAGRCALHLASVLRYPVAKPDFWQRGCSTTAAAISDLDSIRSGCQPQPCTVCVVGGAAAQPRASFQQPSCWCRQGLQ